ncbi:hypothetical protein [Corallococcus sp. 4LFB]|uniref:hypothetical protein n=1 Tax=Corallococcus sp. 4LFB TaxID=3383249 RepID=UPI003975E363
MLTVLVIGGFCAALLAPWAVRLSPRLVSRGLMLLPLGAFVALARALPSVISGAPSSNGGRGRRRWTSG